MTDQTLISIKQAAAMLGVTPLTLRNWDASGKLKALRHPMNNYRVYKLEDINNIVSTMNSTPKPEVRRNRKIPKKLIVKHIE